MKPLNILFLCTGNSCRSQMAEAWANRLMGISIKAFSAGVAPKGIDPNAIKAMAEVDIDISAHSSKDIEAFSNIDFDYVITLCDHANESCPFFPGNTKRIHKGFDDPPKLAEGAASEEEAMIHYRRVRDEIKDYVASFPEGLEE